MASVYAICKCGHFDFIHDGRCEGCPCREFTVKHPDSRVAPRGSIARLPREYVEAGRGHATGS